MRLFLSVARIADLVRELDPQPLHGLLDEGIEPLPALIQMKDDFLAHAGRPESREMIGNAGDRLVMRLRREEFADLIRHIDQLLGRGRVMRHDAGLDQ